MRVFWSRLCSDSWKLDIVGESHIKPRHIGYASLRGVTKTKAMHASFDVLEALPTECSKRGLSRVTRENVECY